jgi:hypothetical protein
MTTSPDGRFWWNGTEWVPFDSSIFRSVSSDDVATGVAGGLVKFVVGLPVIPVAVLLIVLAGVAFEGGSIGPIVAPLLLASGLAFWYFKRLPQGLGCDDLV